MAELNATPLRVSRKRLRDQIQHYGTEDGTVKAALAILAKRMMQRGSALNSRQDVRDYLRLTLAEVNYEVFWAVFLDAQNRVIACEELFRGTLTQTGVYPREVVKRALQHNAAAVIFAHNHPSGVADPSRADEALTKILKDALALVDVKVLDHIIVGGANAMSFAERGII
jgi:DNA repair protein RadC